MPANDAMLTLFEHQDVAIDERAGRHGLSALQAEAAARISLVRPRFCSRGFRSIRFSHYAGVVNVGGRVVEILPKVEASDSTPDNCRGVFLRLLSLAEGLRLHSFGNVGQSIRMGPLLDVFITAFFDDVRRILGAGLLRRYREREEDLTVVRGRILWKRQVGSLAMRPDRVACRFDALDADNDVNRVIKAALAALRPNLRSAGLLRRWSELWPAFDEVALVPAASASSNRIVLDRQTRRYASALRWAGWLLRLLSPSLRAGASDVPGLVFDTNQLFERAVGRHLLRRTSRQGGDLRLSTQETGRFLGAIEADRALPAVPLKPDLVFHKGERVSLVADTKWKRVDVGRTGHVEPATGDVYQMLAYAAAFECNDVALIYPWHAELRDAHETIVRLHSAAGATVRLHVAVVDTGADLLPLRLGASTPVLAQLECSL